ncbi:MAG: hypothetical protein JWQ21_1610 [Herminiimonas sp.]|jgi:hypothetical protein|nr:hypothetical protein [Herminiimonas sp.]
MNPKELDFAYKVRHALNENLDYLPSSTAERLASARNLALSRKKKDSPLRAYVPQYKLAGQVGSFFSEPLSWLSRVSLAVPVVVLALGLTGIYQFEKQQRITEIAEIDALVLADELPLSAYADHGFNAYLAKRGE